MIQNEKHEVYVYIRVGTAKQLEQLPPKDSATEGKENSWPEK